MGERSILEIAEALRSGIPIEEITYVPGTVYKCKDLSRVYEPILLPSYEEVKTIKQHMRKALEFSTKIPIPLLQGLWQSTMEAEAILCRILRLSL